jgi:protein-tyrosine phosphatase
MKSEQWSMASRRFSEVAKRLAAGLDAPFRPGTRKFGGSVLGIDLTWVTGRIAVGGGIWNAENMAAVARAGVTHIIDMQIEFDDTELAKPHSIEVLWNPVDDDFQPKPARVFARGVEFAQEALDQDDSKLLIHCAAGVHRAPMMTLALLCSLSWDLSEAMELIVARRPVADFAEVYVQSVKSFLDKRAGEARRGKTVLSS